MRHLVAAVVASVLGAALDALGGFFQPTAFLVAGVAFFVTESLIGRRLDRKVLRQTESQSAEELGPG